jgi:DNA-3-methyladenine glycosylase
MAASSRKSDSASARAATRTATGQPGARGKRLARGFYRRPAEQLAPALLGKVLVHRVGGRTFAARIVETEAYVGPHDLACHAAKGRTKRTEVMFGPAGFSYVYLIYGMYPMLNIVSGDVGVAEAVLVRAAEAIGWEADLSGPGKLCREMRITLTDNALDLTKRGKLFFLDDDGARRAPRVLTSKRIGIDYAGDWKDALLRFYDADSTAVSKPR